MTMNEAPYLVRKLISKCALSVAISGNLHDDALGMTMNELPGEAVDFEICSLDGNNSHSVACCITNCHARKCRPAKKLFSTLDLSMATINTVLHSVLDTTTCANHTQ